MPVVYITAATTVLKSPGSVNRIEVEVLSKYMLYNTLCFFQVLFAVTIGYQNKKTVQFLHGCKAGNGA